MSKGRLNDDLKTKDTDTDPQATSLQATVGRIVIQRLGTPPDFHKVTATKVRGPFYRVNIYVADYGHTYKSFRLTDSFFVKLIRDTSDDKYGFDIRSTPKIHRRYGCK